jgi:hypothetical protein
VMSVFSWVIRGCEREVKCSMRGERVASIREVCWVRRVWTDSWSTRSDKVFAGRFNTLLFEAE